MSGSDDIESKDQELTDEDVEGVVGGTYVPGGHQPTNGVQPSQTVV